MNAFRSALISTAAQIDYSSLSLVYLLTEWMNISCWDDQVIRAYEIIQPIPKG
ncbi:hypothetical protein LINPERPRIM_LOCUS5653 [Linum perenne]